MWQRQITPCEQVRRLVAATCSNDTSQRQNRFECKWRIFCENLCLCNIILSQQHVAKNQIRQNLCELSRRQNSIAETNIFTKSLQYTQSDLSLRCVATTCCCNLSVAGPVHTEWSVVSTCCCNLSPSVYRSVSVELNRSGCPAAGQLKKNRKIANSVLKNRKIGKIGKFVLKRIGKSIVLSST